MAEEEFAITGLAPSYAFLLMTVIDNPGIQPKDISEHMQLTPSTITRLIEKMEHREFLERVSEGKCTRVFATSKCKKLDKQIRTAWMNLHHRYTRLLGEKRAQALTAEIYSASKILTK
jgi:DNA-binding MarR family transcriptional regulator